jgi:hypothetical protein
MTTACPSCGSAAPSRTREARVLYGTCTACGSSFTIVHNPPDPDAPTGEGGETSPDSASGRSGAIVSGFTPVPALASGPRCSTCGNPLAIRSATSTSLDLACGVCSTSTTYVAAMAELPHRSGLRTGGGRAPSEDRPRAGPPRSRPCRECGGDLRFSAQPDGTVAGECSECGNRFTLPPRRAYARDDRPPSRPRGDYRGGFRSSGPGYSRGRSGPPRAFRVAYRRRPSGDSDEADPRTNRRRRTPQRR